MSGVSGQARLHKLLSIHDLDKLIGLQANEQKQPVILADWPNPDSCGGSEP
jgi:hypothetical protein